MYFQTQKFQQEIKKKKNHLVHSRFSHTSAFQLHVKVDLKYILSPLAKRSIMQGCSRNLYAIMTILFFRL